VPGSLNPFRPFSTQAALAAGISRYQLREPTWRQLTRGVWISPAAAIDKAVWRDSARLVMPPDAVLCGPSALDEYGIDVRPVDDLAVHIALCGQVPRRRNGLVIRQVALQPQEVEVHGSWLVTTPLRTAFDCARWLRFEAGLVAVDALAHQGLIDVSELATLAANKPRVRGVRQVRDIAALADPGAESPMETRLRLLLIRHGLPVPVSQFEVRRPDGRFIGRLDLAYPKRRVAVEYDGALHWKQRRADDRRRDELRAIGWIVLVFSADDVYRYATRTARQVEQVLARRAA
jgi:very-short-patch-repair endonuclease